MYQQTRRSLQTNSQKQESANPFSFEPNTFSPVQRKAKTAKQIQSNSSYSTQTAPAQRRVVPGHEQESQTVLDRNASKTGSFERLKDAVATLYGVDMSDVTVEYNSRIPAQYGAEAIAWKNKIYVASGKEKHVRHELCHIAQQLQGRVKPTMQLEGVPLNDDPKLEREADEMGAKALAISQYNPGTKQGQELTPVVQSNNSGNIIQRAVGFEFQTNWGLQEKLPEKEFVKSKEDGLKGIIPKHKSKRRLFRYKQIIQESSGFKMTTDVADTPLEYEVEWLVDPIEETSGINAVYEVMNRLEVMARSMVQFQQRETSFTLDEVTGNPNDSRVEVHPNIKGEAVAENMKANPQVTGGVRLDQIANMFAQLGNPRDGGPHQQVREELMGMGGADILAKSATAANNIQGSAALKGLAAQIIAYLIAGKLPDVMQSYIAESDNPERAAGGQAFKYAKLIAKIMARTDFGSQFKLLPEAERQRFENNPQEFADLILSVAGVGNGNNNVFERKIRNSPNNPDEGAFDFPVTRNEWLINITQGKDLLTQRIFHRERPDDNRDTRLGAMGAMGDQTDRVGPNNVSAPIFEFRQANSQIPYTEWCPFAVRVFQYLTELNRQQDGE